MRARCLRATIRYRVRSSARSFDIDYVICSASKRRIKIYVSYPRDDTIVASKRSINDVTNDTDTVTNDSNQRDRSRQRNGRVDKWNASLLAEEGERRKSIAHKHANRFAREKYTYENQRAISMRDKLLQISYGRGDI